MEKARRFRQHYHDCNFQSCIQRLLILYFGCALAWCLAVVCKRTHMQVISKKTFFAMQLPFLQQHVYLNAEYNFEKLKLSHSVLNINGLCGLLVTSHICYKRLGETKNIHSNSETTENIVAIFYHLKTSSRRPETSRTFNDHKRSLHPKIQTFNIYFPLH